MRRFFLTAVAVSLLPTAAACASPQTPPRKPLMTAVSIPLGTEKGFDVSAAVLLKTAPDATAFPNAGAYVLRDEETDLVHADGTSEATTHETARIFNSRGRGWADASVSFNSATQSVVAIHARTVLPDGRVLTVKPSEIHVTDPYSDYTMYDDAKSLSFSMPGVEDGAIIDYTYTVVDKKDLMPGQFENVWTFQNDTDPVRLSRLTIVAPASLPIKAQLDNMNGAVVNVTPEGSEKKYVYEMTNLPDWTAEPMMPPAETYQPHVEVSTLPTWQAMAHWYQGLAAPRMEATPAVKTLVHQLILGKTTDTEKAKALFYWVEGKTRYVALELGLSAYQPHSADEVCTNRYGDCKDMAALLVTMLHEAGIKTAWPVLLQADDQMSTQGHLPSPGSFDHSIARADIDGKPYWFDCTAELCSFGQIPGGDRGVEALVIRDGVGTFETIPVGSPEDNQMVMSSQVALKADGSAECTTSVQSSGDAALGLRGQFRAIKPDQMQQTFQDMARQYGTNATLTKYTLASPEDRDAAMVYGFSYHAPVYAQSSGSFLIITPSSLSVSDFSLPTRHFPAYHSSSSKMVVDTNITLPADYVLEETPGSMHVAAGPYQIDKAYTLTGAVLNSHTIVKSTLGTISTADYPDIKAKLDSVVAQSQKPLVLRRKSAVNQ